LTGMSAAKAEPVTIASAVANKATFFISIPITSSQTPVGSRKPPGANDLTAKLRNCDNLEGGMQTVKQKTRASADFLGVLTIPRKVVTMCCFPITLFCPPQCTRGTVAGTGPRDRGARATNRTGAAARQDPGGCPGCLRRCKKAAASPPRPFWLQSFWRMPEGA
jgi:hypothetical protein